MFRRTDCHFSLAPAVMEARPSHPASETAIQPQRLRSSRSTRRWRQGLISSSIDQAGGTPLHSATPRELSCELYAVCPAVRTRCYGR